MHISSVKRRAFLAGMTAGVSGLAGCGSSGGIGGNAFDPGETTAVQSFQFDNQNSGYAPDRTGPKTEPDATWQFGAGDSSLSPPIIHDEIVFTKDDGAIYALDAADGTLQWEAAVSSNQSAYPVLGDQRLFVPTENGVTAFDPTDGTELWQSTVNAPVAPPVMDGDRLLTTGRFGGLSEIAIADGRVRGDVSTGDDTEGIALSEEGTICVLGDEGLYIAPEMGQEPDLVPVDGNPRAPPTIIGTTAYVTAQGSGDPGLYGIDIEAEEVILEIEGDMGISVADGSGTRVVGAGGPAEDILVAYDTENPDDPAWASEVATTITSPVVTKNAAFVGAGGPGEGGVIAAVGLRIPLSWEESSGDPKPLWTYELNAEISSPPAVTESAVYAVDDAGTVYGLAE